MILLPKLDISLREEATRVRKLYVPETVEDFEKIARREYGIEVVRTPLCIGAGLATLFEGKPLIFYEGFGDLSKRVVLGHEIGHVVAGHLTAESVEQYNFSDRVHRAFEDQADLFARKILGINKKGYAELGEIDQRLMFNYINAIKNFDEHIATNFDKLDPKHREIFPLEDLVQYWICAQDIAGQN